LWLTFFVTVSLAAWGRVGGTGSDVGAAVGRVDESESGRDRVGDGDTGGRFAVGSDSGNDPLDTGEMYGPG